MVHFRLPQFRGAQETAADAPPDVEFVHIPPEPGEARRETLGQSGRLRQPMSDTGVFRPVGRRMVVGGMRSLWMGLTQPVETRRNLGMTGGGSL